MTMMVLPCARTRQPSSGTMVDERSVRRPGFIEGTRIRLADGQSWSFPASQPDRDDPEYDQVLRAVFEAEDDAERLRAELALTILLLARNYHLGPADYQELLGYPPGDPALARLQREVHQMVLDHAEKLGIRGKRHRTSDPVRPVPGTGDKSGGDKSGPVNRRSRLRSAWSLWLN